MMAGTSNMLVAGQFKRKQRRVRDMQKAEQASSRRAKERQGERGDAGAGTER